MASELSDLVAAARTLDAAFNHHANTGELDRLVAACYADDAVVLPPNLPPVQGRGQIRELFRELTEAGSGEVVRETTALHVTGDLGYGIGKQTATIRRPGQQATWEVGKFLLIYRRQADGTWKIAVDMFSSDVPEGSCSQTARRSV